MDAARLARIVLVVAALSPLASARAEVTAAAMAEAGRNLVATLTPEQHKQAIVPFDDEQRFDWHFIPKARKGLPLKAMTQAQRHLASAFLSTGLSQRGYMKATTIMSLEEILRDMQAGGGAMVRDEALYYFTLFGEPSEKENWGWSIEGHHISLNFTVVGGKMVASEPAFFGSNPAEVRDGPRKGLRVLGHEEDIARALLKSLDAAQRKAAVIDATAPSDILSFNKRKVDPLDPKGLPVSGMTPAQKELTMSLLLEYAGTMPADLAEQRMDKVRKAGLEKIVFAWAGGAERGQKHYYRLQGPTFLVEYDNTQNDGNHVHSVWRDFNGDFGVDLLAEHYKSAPHTNR